MKTYRCDGCGVELPEHALRYTVKIDVRAAYDELEIGLAELVRNHRQELLDLIERLKNKDPRELEETIYKCITLDLCPSCQRAYIRGPLRFHPEQGVPRPDIDVDKFLRSLGYGGSGDNQKHRAD
ncbi:MAG TPA: hypothetical protein HPP77_03690 [Candidatus Hydrogenedentes bacterium]|nr:hypothetical protein [Candidatus Hydrogenedentota bacterium]